MIAIAEDIQVLPRTLAEFMDWIQPEDGCKYEWNDGELIKSENMNKRHLILIRILNRLFAKTTAYQEGGELIQEQDVRLSGIQLRRPDLAYFSAEQIDNSINDDEEPIPEFVIEIISTNDQLNIVEDKIIEYFKAGVRVIWNILPQQKVVYVYTSRREVKICLEQDICSAAPILPDFEIKAEELFL